MKRNASQGSSPGKAPYLWCALAALLPAALALLIIGGLAPRQFESQRRAGQAAVETMLAAGAEAQTLLGQLQAADAAMHDFVLTGAAGRLKAYRENRDRATRTISGLDRLVSGDESARASLRRIASLAETAFDRLADLRPYAPGEGAQFQRPPEQALVAARAAVRNLDEGLAALLRLTSAAAAEQLSEPSRSAERKAESVLFPAIFFGIGGGFCAAGLAARRLAKRERRLRQASDGELAGATRELVAANAALREQNLLAAEAERKMDERSRDLRAILDAVGEAVVALDPSGNCSLVNPAAERLLGRGLAFAGLSHFRERYQFRRSGDHAAESPVARALEGESVDGEEYAVQVAESSVAVHVTATARPLRSDAGQPRGAFVVMRVHAAPNPAANQATNPAPNPAANPEPPPPPVAPEHIDMRELLETAAAQVEALADAKRVSLRAAIGPAWARPVFAPRAPLSAALEAALAEAIAASQPEGAVTISCEETGAGCGRLTLQTACPGAPPRSIEAPFAPSSADSFNADLQALAAGLNGAGSPAPAPSAGVTIESAQPG